MDIKNYIKKIFKLKSETEFNDYAIRLFNYQYNNNEIYNNYVDLIKTDISKIKHYNEIPAIPIELFRTKKIISKKQKPEIVFFSSGTTNAQKSKHHIINLEIYKQAILNGFSLFFGAPKNFIFFCLIPEFQTHPNSSLSFMCSELIKHSNNNESGFYLGREHELIVNIKSCKKKNRKFILFGLSFEILNFAKKNNINLDTNFVIQTGGTKKNSNHIAQEDLHQQLKSLFNTKNIYSEYGMAELLSQSYYIHNDCFQPPPWKKILIRNKTNPLKIISNNNRGYINIIDLANVYSCGFIATNDLGALNKNGFNILGRSPNSIERGCSLMI